MALLENIQDTRCSDCPCRIGIHCRPSYETLRAELARVKQECAEPQKEIKRIRESYARHFAAAKEVGARSAFEIAGQRITQGAAEITGDSRPETEKEKQWRLTWIEDCITEWRKREAKQDE